jgi:hypothetical protein
VDAGDALWSFRPGTIDATESLKGFAVEAADGQVGTVAWATYAPGESYLVVDVRHGLRETHHVVPAAAVLSVDPSTRTLRLELSRQEVDAAPEHHDPSAPVDLASVDFLAGLWPTWLH